MTQVPGRIGTNRTRSRMAHALAMLLLVQLLIPLQAHSRISHDGRGLVVLVCTLDGFKQVRIPTETPDAVPAPLSPAMLFSDLVHDLSPALSVTPSPCRILTWGTILPLASVNGRHDFQALYRSRDPPRAG